jgi:hypothetical protein
MAAKFKKMPEPEREAIVAFLKTLRAPVVQSEAKTTVAAR